MPTDTAQTRPRAATARRGVSLTKQPPPAPIYDGLVAEQGDVPAHVRAVAEELRDEVAEALDFSDLGEEDEGETSAQGGPADT